VSTIQTALQMEYLAKQMQWPGTSESVFWDVVASLAPWSQIFGRLATPFLVINLQGGDSNGNDNRKGIRDNLSATIVTVKDGDPLGRDGLVGSNRDPDGPSVAQTGVLEILEQLVNTFHKQGREKGFENPLIFSGWRLISGVENDASVAVLEANFSQQNNNFRWYSPVADMGVTAVASPVITWTDAPARWDSVSTAGVVICRRTDQAPTSPTDNPLTSVNRGVQSYTDNTASASTTYYYSIFQLYDETYSETLSAPGNGYSDAISRTVTTP